MFISRSTLILLCVAFVSCAIMFGGIIIPDITGNTTKGYPLIPGYPLVKFLGELATIFAMILVAILLTKNYKHSRRELLGKALDEIASEDASVVMSMAKSLGIIDYRVWHGYVPGGCSMEYAPFTTNKHLSQKFPAPSLARFIESAIYIILELAPKDSPSGLECTRDKRTEEIGSEMKRWLSQDCSQEYGDEFLESLRSRPKIKQIIASDSEVKAAIARQGDRKVKKVFAAYK